MRLLLVRSADMVGAQTMAVLDANGLTFDQFDNLADATEALMGHPYNGILLSRRLPDGDGAAWLAGQRARGLSIPVMVVTANDDVEDKIRLLDAGADDYVHRGVAGREMLSRLRAILRRPPTLASTNIQVGNVRLDTASRQVWVGAQSVPVPRRELDLLEHLMSRGGRVVPRTLLESNLYGMSEDICSNSLEVRISRVRKHLAAAGANVSIKTVRGIGYILEEDQAAARPMVGA